MKNKLILQCFKNVIIVPVYKLVEEESSNVTQLRDAFDWYIQPSVNPDGYEYTWTTNRMWRKTRKPNQDSECIGTDGNRNFEIGWGGSKNMIFFWSCNQPLFSIYMAYEF